LPQGEDCNDDDAAVHPGADEICNGVDDDCDGLVDEGCPNDGGEGCGCTAAPNSGSAWLFLLGLALLSRRKRKKQHS